MGRRGEGEGGKEGKRGEKRKRGKERERKKQTQNWNDNGHVEEIAPKIEKFPKN